MPFNGNGQQPPIASGEPRSEPQSHGEPTAAPTASAPPPPDRDPVGGDGSN
jgi:hypothetical protein